MDTRQFFDLNVTPNLTTASGEKQLFDLNSSPNMIVEENTHNHQPKRKRLDDQTQEVLEAFFEECTHPKKRHREELSRQLGMEVQRIKYWFQNKRNQMKSQNMRQKNANLRRENEELRLENDRMREEIAKYGEPLLNYGETFSFVAQRNINQSL